MAAPWSDCKVGFGIINPDRFTAAMDRGAAVLPVGWEHCETDGAGARWVIVFRVSIMPTVEDGRAVASLIRRWGR
jgi:hypothetical protein